MECPDWRWRVRGSAVVEDAFMEKIAQELEWRLHDGDNTKLKRYVLASTNRRRLGRNGFNVQQFDRFCSQLIETKEEG